MRKISIAIMVALVACLFIGIASMQKADAATIYVPDQDTLQGAINNASTGDTIHINATTLSPGNIVWVNKTVTIEGNGTAYTFINASGLSYGLNITAENVTIRNLTIYSATSIGINIETGTVNISGTPTAQTPNNLTIDNVYIHNCSLDGIAITAGNNSTIKNSVIEHNDAYGIKVTGGIYGSIVGNELKFNGNADNEGGLYMTKDLHWAVVGNLFEGNNQDGIYSTENTNYDTTVYLYNMFKNNTAYGIESPGGTIRGDHNCWYNETAGTWGGKPNAAGVDNISSSVTANIYYNGTVVEAGVALTQDGTHTYGISIPYVTFVYHDNHTYNHWLAGARFSTLPIGTASNHYTLYPVYGAFNLSGRDQTAPGLTTGEWINVTLYYDFDNFPSALSSQKNDATVMGVWHWNNGWAAPTNRGKNTTDSGSYEGYAWVNFTSNPTSPLIILLDGKPTAKFDYYPSEPNVNEEVIFDASDSTDVEDNDDLSTYHWNFGDGESAVGKNVTHTFDEADDYVVTLTVTDYAGRSATVKHTVTVSSGAVTTAGVAPGQGDYTLTVTVYDTSGNLIDGATVGLYSNGILLDTKTTVSGQVIWNNVEGMYQIKASKVGYTDASKYVIVSQDTSATLTMSKEAIYFGLSLYGWVAFALFIFAIASLIIVAGYESYRRYWYVPLWLSLASLIVALIYPVFTTYTFNFWLLFATVSIFVITLILFCKEIKKSFGSSW